MKLIELKECHENLIKYYERKQIFKHKKLKENLASIVLPVYNGSEFLKDSIDSVLNQTYRPIELIIVNDGSTDETESIIKLYQNSVEVTVLKQTNKGLPVALTNGFEQAQGEFWTWTSADNLMEPNMIDTLVAKLKSNKEIGMVYSDYYAIDANGAPLKAPSWRAHNRPDLESGEVRLPRSTENLSSVPDNFIGPCFLYRGTIGQMVGAYNAPVGVEDYDYWLRLQQYAEIQHLGSDELLYKYKVHERSITSIKGKNLLMKLTSIIMRKTEKLK
jgi:glycosyltransferase involved in cell wall biosynthesis